MLVFGCSNVSAINLSFEIAMFMHLTLCICWGHRYLGMVGSKQCVVCTNRCSALQNYEILNAVDVSVDEDVRFNGYKS